jgi:hypothetical protein
MFHGTQKERSTVHSNHANRAQSERSITATLFYPAFRIKLSIIMHGFHVLMRNYNTIGHDNYIMDFTDEEPTRFYSVG